MKKFNALEQRKILIRTAESKPIRDGYLLLYSHQHRKLHENFYKACLKIMLDTQIIRRKRGTEFKGTSARLKRTEKPHQSFLQKIYMMLIRVFQKNREQKRHWDTPEQRVKEYMKKIRKSHK